MRNYIFSKLDQLRNILQTKLFTIAFKFEVIKKNCKIRV